MWRIIFYLSVFYGLIFNQVSAVVLFESEFANGMIRYVGDGDKHPGSGRIQFLGGEIWSFYTPSDGCGGLLVQDVVMDSSAAAQGGPAGAQTTALKTHYRAGICGMSFQKNTTIIRFNAQNEIYIRWYQKWSDQWIWPNVQQKFLKIESDSGPTKFSQNFYFQAGGYMRLNYFKNGSQTTSYDPNNDSINNGLGPNGEDIRVVMTTGDWHEVQMHVLGSTPTNSDGRFRYWIDGALVFDLQNVKNRSDDSTGIDIVELQHVYETGNPKTGPIQDMPTWMKNIVISTTFIPKDCPACPMPPSNLIVQ